LALRRGKIRKRNTARAKNLLQQLQQHSRIPANKMKRNAAVAAVWKVKSRIHKFFVFYFLINKRILDFPSL
jgi:hypothetical protein